MDSFALLRRPCLCMIVGIGVLLWHVGQVSGDDHAVLVAEYMRDELAAAVQTAWSFITFESNPQPAEFDRVVAVVPGTHRPHTPPPYKFLPNARLLQCPFTGFDVFNISEIPSAWWVANVHQGGVPVSEYVIASLLMWNLQFSQADYQFRHCTWKSTNNTCVAPMPHQQASGQTVGIIGFGDIGRHVATRAAALEMRVIAVDRSPPNITPASVFWIRNDTFLSQLLEESDFVVLCVPLTNATKGLLNAAMLGRMRHSAVLINPARGPIVDQEALYNVLAQHQIAGAVFDVWWNDFAWLNSTAAGASAWPAKWNFSALDNVVMTPHFSALTAQAHVDAVRQSAANLDRWARGEGLENVVRRGSTIYF